MKITLDVDRVALRRRGLRGIGWATLQKAGTRLASLMTFVALGRLLAPEDFGLVAAAGVVVGLVTLLLELGLAHYLVQTVDLEDRCVDTAFWTGLGLAIAAACLSAAGAPLAAVMFEAPELTLVLVALSGAVPLAALGAVPQALLRRSLSFDIIAKRSLVGIVASAAIGIGLALAGAGVWALVAQTYAQNLVTVILFYGFAGWRPRLQFDRTRALDMLRFGSAMWGMGVMSFVRSRADELFVGIFLGPATLGVYFIAKRILMVILDLLVGVIYQVVPATLAAAKQDHERVRRGFLLTVSATSLITAPAVAYLIIASPTLVPLLFGEQWTEAGPVAQILALGGLAFVLTVFDRGLYLALDRPLVELLNSAVTTLMTVLVYAILAQHGLNWAALGFVGMQWVSWTWRLAVLRRASGIHARSVLARILPAVFASTVVGALAGVVAIWLGQVPGIAAASVLAAIVALLYPLLVRAIDGHGLSELVSILPPRMTERKVLSWLLTSRRRSWAAP